jgi:hypothetical protein
VFQELDRSGIRWALLHPAPDWQHIASDIDLLMDARDLGLAESVLRRAGFVRVPMAPFDAHRHYLRYEPERDRWLWLDIATELRFGPYGCLRIPAEDACLARRNVKSLGAELTTADAFWLRMLRTVLDGRDAERLRPLFPASADDDDLADRIRRACPEFDTAELRRCAGQGDWAGLAATGKVAADRVNWRHRWWTFRHRCAVASKLMARFRMRGVVIAVRGRQLAEAVGRASELPLRTLARGGDLVTIIAPEPGGGPVSWLRHQVQSRLAALRGRLVIWLVPGKVQTEADGDHREIVNAVWQEYARRWQSR